MVITLGGGGLFAYFSATETSRGNVFNAGEWPWPPPTDSGGTIGFWGN
jgi:predicted ribosomally synthesized peptide with SipW-like signal peptide